MRKFSSLSFLLPLLFLAGCSPAAEKTANLSAVYGAAVIASLLVLIGYCCIVKQKDIRYLLLFASVLVVNAGYFALSVSKTLAQALLANRLAYLGSVFLPLAMWLIILKVTGFRYSKWLTGLLLGIGTVVFLIAASPGYLTVYYQEASFEIVNGVGVLNKVYGPLHILYLFYLLGYFAAMIGTILLALRKKRLISAAYAVILMIAVFVNICVWTIEQLVQIDFEILSVSYIISECFLLGLQLLMAERKDEPLPVPAVPAETTGPSGSPLDPVQLDLFTKGVSQLTPTERIIYEAYLAGKTTKQIMEQLNIKENTLKFHNKNIYSKLGVSSRKQLLEIHSKLISQ